MVLCQNLLPENVDLTIEYVAALEKVGQKALADERYDQAFTFHDKTCDRFPKSANAHNTLAWLGACCRRDLDKAVEHGKLANALVPNRAGYLDTLAEAYFQRGDHDAALATMKRCVELEPSRAYYQKQLKRFTAGDRSVPIPTADGDE
jgi:tetratricopeptide (TPR) repeat protein